MPDGSIVFNVDLDNKDAQAKFNRLAKSVDALNDKISLTERKRLPLLEQSEKLTLMLDAAKAKLAEMQSASVGTYPKAAIFEQKERVRILQKEWDGVQDTLDKYSKTIQDATIEMEWAKEKAGEIAKRTAVAESNTKKMRKATQKASKHMGVFATRLRGIALSAFVFNILSRGFRELTEWMGNVIKTNKDARAAIARLKGALLTMVQPIVQAVIPAFVKFVDLLASAVSVLAQLVSMLFGTTLETSNKAANSLYNEQQAIEGVGDAAQKAEGQLASFDEINKLAESSAGGISDTIAPDFSGITSSTLPGWLTSMTLNLHDILFKWKNLSKEDILKKLIAALTTLAGGVIGFSLGGVKGAVIGILIGATVGALISTLTFDNDGVLSKEEVAKIICMALFALVGGVIGFSFGGPTGAFIGITVGAGVMAALNNVLFDNDGVVNRTEVLKLLCAALGALVGGVIGFFVGGPAGAAIGMAIGATVTITLTDVFFDGFDNVKKSVPNFKGIGPDYSWMVKSKANVPGLATGSVVPPNRKFLAVLGDNKTEPEVVSPLSTMKQAFMEAMQESGGGGAFTCIVNLDGKEVARNTVKHVNDMTRSAGKPVLLV